MYPFAASISVDVNTYWPISPGGSGLGMVTTLQQYFTSNGTIGRSGISIETPSGSVGRFGFGSGRQGIMCWL